MNDKIFVVKLNTYKFFFKGNIFNLLIIIYMYFFSFRFFDLKYNPNF